MGSENRYDGIEECVVGMVKQRARIIAPDGMLGVFSREDVEQELMIAALEARAKCGALRTASARTYIYSAIRKAAASLTQHVYAEKRGWGIRKLSLTQPVGVDGEVCSLEEIITRRSSSTPTGEFNPFALGFIDLRIDIATVMERLSPEEREICRLLAMHPLNDAARLLGVSRQRLGYRRRKLAKKFRAIGIIP